MDEPLAALDFENEILPYIATLKKNLKILYFMYLIKWKK